MNELRSSVKKTFALLEYFTHQKPEWGVTELALACQSNKSTVYRFLNDLQQLGVLIKNPQSDRYSLGLKLFELGNRVPIQTAFVDATHPILEQIAQDITETVHIGILKSNQVFHIDKVTSPQGLTLNNQIGSFSPAFATALGKVLLAFLPKKDRKRFIKTLNLTEQNAFTANTITKIKTLKKELNTIKAQGYAIDREEFELGLICVGIPIFNQNNEVIASLSASGPASRFQEEKVLDYVATLKKGANLIKEKIGYYKP